ncbi:MAG: sulfurtransferase TusA family protein [Deltaproteobacteria bacterium]
MDPDPDIGPPERSLDTSGTFCPLPIIETAKLVKAMAPGERLLVIGTDPGIESDMPAWCRSTRNGLERLWREGASIRAIVRKGEPSVTLASALR